MNNENPFYEFVINKINEVMSKNEVIDDFYFHVVSNNIQLSYDKIQDKIVSYYSRLLDRYRRYGYYYFNRILSIDEVIKRYNYEVMEQVMKKDGINNAYLNMLLVKQNDEISLDKFINRLYAYYINESSDNLPNEKMINYILNNSIELKGLLDYREYLELSEIEILNGLHFLDMLNDDMIYFGFNKKIGFLHLNGYKEYDNVFYYFSYKFICDNLHDFVKYLIDKNWI